MVIANNNTFLKNVCQLVKIRASPKQPQSLTGFAIAKYNVSGVINIIVNKTNQEVKRRYEPKNMFTPIINSNAAKSTANIRDKGIRNSKPKATK